MINYVHPFYLYKDFINQTEQQQKSRKFAIKNFFYTPKHIPIDVIESKNKFEINSINMCFSLTTLKIISETAKKYIEIIYPSASIEKIKFCKIKGLFDEQSLYLYKICEILEDIIDEKKVKFKKITVLATFERERYKKCFNYFYYAKFNGSNLNNYNDKHVIASKKIFGLFLKNFCDLLQKDCLFITYDCNVFYSLFINYKFDYFIKYISFYITSEICSESYVELVNHLYQIFQFRNQNIILAEFFCNNYKLMHESFFNTIKYNGKDIISDMKKIKKENIIYKKNIFYILQLFYCYGKKFNLCILPIIDRDICSKFIKTKRTEINKIFRDIIVEEENKFLAGLDDKYYLNDKYSKKRQFDFDNKDPNFYEVINEYLLIQYDTESMHRVFKTLDIEEFTDLFMKIMPLQLNLHDRFFCDLLFNNTFYRHDFAQTCLDNVNKRNIENNINIENSILEKKEPLIFEKAKELQKKFLKNFKKFINEMAFRFNEHPKKIIIIGFTDNANYSERSISNIISNFNHTEKLNKSKLFRSPEKFKFVTSF